ncbi:extracellular solute-binding protein family 1 [Beutenbergia cavernae DSM 12333]|uniref:Extracellular solute-binding protein family 1 n=1 Tax=Beutenbergia cavernae (strain ATCC BAA-8 / DSM 12333 / CCUG 43141 / JCM 11478 / NBRC 16432 / NCIMB 13614 / HKI 0122) TaxID=471853 RepID=C5C391_BEUC1|nr:extracellular solute-binding protein [Beutenbergia cavernae]ACQ79790.1 extracellular solute-binding protein family 1 [Beutenbergia cavernae DSM 12333]
MKSTRHTPRRTIRRPAAAAAVTASLALALAACGVGGGDAPGADETVGPASDAPIRATWWGVDNQNQALDAAIASFTEAGGPEVAVEPQPWDGYWDKLATLVAGRDLPDVVMQAASQLPTYAERDSLLDLSQVDLDTSGLDAGIRDFGTVGDASFGVVAATNATGFVTNADLLGELGVDAPAGEWTWDDLAAFADQVRMASAGETWGVQDGSGDLILFILYVRDSGREFYADDGSLNATPDDLRAWLQLWADMREAGSVPPADVTAESAGNMPGSPLATGRAAASFAWTQDYVALQAVTDSALDIGLPPHNTEHPSLWINAASLWSISATSGNPQGAADLIDHLVNDPGAVEELGATLGIPPTAEARAQIAESVTDEELPAVEYMDIVAENSRPLNRLWPDGFADSRTLLGQLAEAVAFGQTSIDDAVDAFFADAEG